MNIPRFKKVTEGLYRGGRPSPSDVVHLKNDYGINKIISLDERCGKNISDICKKLGINHYIFHLDDSRKSLLRLFRNDLKELLLNNGPVFFHCYHGKDRTGLLAAVFKCKFLGMDPKDALKEAESFGFGINLNPNWIKLYKEIILTCKPSTDENFASIVDNQRSFYGYDNSDYLNEADRKSFSPIMQPLKQHPFQEVYPDFINHYNANEFEKPIKSYKNDNFPASGVFETEKYMAGAGFSLANINMDKFSYILDMSYDISNIEKQKADQAIMLFDQVIKNLYKANDYLQLISEPFEKQSDITTDEIMNVRVELRRFRDNLLEKFNDFKHSAVQCLKIMETFSSDTQTLKLIKVFISSIDNLEESVNDFVLLFSNLEDEEFVNNIILGASKIQQLSDDLEEIINNRIIKHIKTNILASSWVDSVGTNYFNFKE